MNHIAIVNLGEQRFDKLREEHRFCIDKTDLIRDWWETGSTVTLITRPRRFGKTLNTSMLECFFSNKYASREDLFEGLSIWSDSPSGNSEKYRHLQGTYPAIFISFAKVKAARYEDMAYKLTKVIADLYEQNRSLLEGNLLSENEKNTIYDKGEAYGNSQSKNVLCGTGRNELDMGGAQGGCPLCGAD